MGRTLKTLLVAVAVLAASGCASLPPGEAVYQGLHSLDVAQTVEIARNPEKFQEADVGTRCLIGSHPTEAHVIEWGVANAVAHYAIDDYLYRTNHPKLALLFESASIAFVADTVHHNYKIGLGYGFR